MGVVVGVVVGVGVWVVLNRRKMADEVANKTCKPKAALDDRQPQA